MSSLSKLLSSLSLVFSICLISSDVLAYGQQANINRLFEAVENVVDADAYLEGGQNYQANTRLRVASYRVRIVLAQVKYTPGLQKPTEALQVTLDKLNDSSLYADEKVSIALDCLSVALTELIKRESYYTGPLEAALQNLRLVKLVNQAQAFGPIVSILQTTKRYLVGSCPISTPILNSARDAINVAIDKATDSGLSYDERAFFVLDCVNVAIGKIRQLT